RRARRARRAADGGVCGGTGSVWFRDRLRDRGGCLVRGLPVQAFAVLARLPLELVDELVDRAREGAGGRVRAQRQPARADRRLRSVVLRDLGVGLDVELELDLWVVELALQPAELPLRVRPHGLADLDAPALHLESHGVLLVACSESNGPAARTRRR